MHAARSINDFESEETFADRHELRLASEKDVLRSAACRYATLSKYESLANPTKLVMERDDTQHNSGRAHSAEMYLTVSTTRISAIIN